MVLYAGFTILTKIEIGYMSLLVGIIIGKAMMMGSKGIGGRQYQITAVVLTYLVVALSEIPIVVALRGIPLSYVSWGEAIPSALASPFQDLKTDTFHGVIGLVILFVGMNIAWKLTAEKPRPAA